MEGDDDEIAHVGESVIGEVIGDEDVVGGGSGAVVGGAHGGMDGGAVVITGETKGGEWQWW